MTLNDEFPMRLAEARAKKGISQQDLAELTGIAAAQLSRYESGKNRPRPALMNKLADALGVGVGWLAAGRFTVEMPSALETIYLTGTLRHQLEVAAEMADHSLSDEITARLVESFSTNSPEKNGAPLVRVILDSSGYPQSWDEIEEHLRAIRKLLVKPTVAYENTIITPDMVSSSMRAKESEALKTYYKEKVTDSVNSDKMALLKHLVSDMAPSRRRKKS